MKPFRVTGRFKEDHEAVMDVYVDAADASDAAAKAESHVPALVRSWTPHELTGDEILTEFREKRGDVTPLMKAFVRRSEELAS